MNYWITPGIAPEVLTSDILLNIVAKHCEVSVDEMKGKKRIQHIADARHITMYILRKKTAHSLKRIGQIMGCRDHSTVLHGINKIQDYLCYEKAVKDTVGEILKDIRFYERKIV